MKADIGLSSIGDAWRLMISTPDGFRMAEISHEQFGHLIAGRILTDIDLVPSPEVEFVNDVRWGNDYDPDPSCCANVRMCAEAGEGCVCSWEERRATQSERERHNAGKAGDNT